MEYVQTVLVRIAAEKIGDATGSAGVIGALERHRGEIRRRPGFLRMTITRANEEGGDSLLSVETRWRDATSLDGYVASEPNAVSIVRAHNAELVPDSMQVRRMEALESESEEAKRGVVYERFAIALLVPVGIVAFGLAIIYSLSRVYLEVGNEAATLISALVALSILLAAWYFASNPGAIRVQVPALAMIVVALLLGGTVYAQVHDGPFYEEAVHGGEEPTPGAGGGDFQLVLEDNVFLFGGQENPTIEVGAGVEIVLPLVNEGAALHNVHVASTGAYEQDFCDLNGENPCSDPPRIVGGADGTLTFNLPVGTYDYRCDYHPDQMVGQFTAVEGGPTGAPPPAGEPPAGEPPPGDGAQTIDMDDNVFILNDEENPTISIAADTDATFTVANVGTALHNLHVAVADDFESDFCNGNGSEPCSDPPRVSGGSSGTITLNLPAGEYQYRCDYHPDEMQGTIQVE